MDPITKHYIRNLPKGIPEAAAQAFITSTALSVASGEEVREALTRGSLSALATVVGGLLRPVVESVIPEDQDFLVHLCSAVFACALCSLATKSIEIPGEGGHLGGHLYANLGFVSATSHLLRKEWNGGDARAILFSNLLS